MAIIERNFTGNLDLDSHPYRVDPRDFTSAFNITRDAEGAGQDGPISGVPGNQPVAYTLPEGECIGIGGYPDNLRNRYYMFIWNVNSRHSVLYFDGNTRTIVKVLENITDSQGVDIMPFNQSYRIFGVNILRRTEGDILFFTDRLTRPYKFDIDLLVTGSYGIVNPETIRVARMPPQDALLPKYGSDDSVIVNNFKKKLFRYIYRWGYNDGEKSTWSPISKAITPTDGNEVDFESNPRKNNFVTLSVTGGAQDYKTIEIAFQQSLGTTWSDFQLIDTLDRIDNNIAPGGTYNYIFFNDSAYPYLDVKETDLLFDWVPDIANTQELANGQYLLYAGLTDGYDQIPRSDINVQLTSSLIDTTISPGTPSIEWDLLNDGHGYRLDFQIGVIVQEGYIYRIQFKWPIYNGDDRYVDVFYEAQAGDFYTDVAEEFVTLIRAALPGFIPADTCYIIAPGKLEVKNNLNHQYPFENILVGVTVPALKSGGVPTWKWNSKYRFGLVYFDKYGKTNGVISFVTNNDDPSDFAVTTPDFNYTTTVGAGFGLPQIPAIYASINHIPPIWATRFQWVRTPNLTIDYFLEYITAEVQEANGYYYFCIENLPVYKEGNTGFVPSYSFVAGDRLRVYAQVNTNDYTVPDIVRDFEILGTAQRDMTGGSNKGLFLKIKKPSDGITYGAQMMIELYRPAIRSVETSQFFYGFGESYPITIDPATQVHYHVGSDQNQTISQPATFSFLDGDVYYKFRDFYPLLSGAIAPTSAYSKFVMDANYSDLWASAVNSNGRAYVIDPYAKRAYYPTQIRFGGAYQQGTDINNINRFYFEDEDEYDRNYGDVMRLHVRNRVLDVYQQAKVGWAPILTQVVRDVQGNPLEANTEVLINKIQYYAGDYGIGDAPESLAFNNFADYFVDNFRGVVCQKVGQKITPISIEQKTNSFYVQRLKNFRQTLNNGLWPTTYPGNPIIIGAFDAYTNKYILALQDITRYDETGDITFSQGRSTMTFNEKKNGFESLLSFTPEWIDCLNTLVVSIFNAILYTHDSPIYCNFYGSQASPNIQVVLNDGHRQKKNYLNITVQSNQQPTSTIKTSLNQSSNLLFPDYELQEGLYNANFRTDRNSPGGVNDGDALKGDYMIIDFQPLVPSNFVFLNSIWVEVADSPKNSR